MALTGNQMQFAYYVIATVESGCNYGAVNQSDAITLGIIQFYGQHAYELLTAVQSEAPDAYALLSSRLRGLVDGGAQTWDYWTNVYLQNDDASSWVASAQLASNKAAQDHFSLGYLFGSDGNGGSYGTLRGWGLGDDPKTAIFYLAMYHQRPASASACMGQLGGSASIDSLYLWTLSNSILNSYKNRYQTVRDLLAQWDGTSAPPDFGTVDPTLPNDPSGSIEAGDLQSTLAYVQAWGDDLIAFGDMSTTERLLLRNTGRGIWIPVDGTVPENPGGGSPSGGDMPPASPDDPADFPAMRQLWYDHANEWSYSQGAGRLDPPTSGYSDCSACIYWAANAATNGKYANMGTWTGAMLQNGHLVRALTSATGFTIDLSWLRPGDLLIMDYNGDSSTDHVDWYMGGTTVWGAGSAPLPHHVTDDVEHYYETRGIRQLWIVRFLD